MSKNPSLSANLLLSVSQAQNPPVSSPNHPNSPPFSPVCVQDIVHRFPGLQWHKGRKAWYLRVCVPKNLQDVLGKREIRKSLSGIPKSQLPQVIHSSIKRLKELFMDLTAKQQFLDTYKMFGLDLKTVAQNYVDGTLKVSELTYVEGFVYGGEGAGIIRDALESQIERYKRSKTPAHTQTQVSPQSQPDAPKKTLPLSEASSLYMKSQSGQWSDKTIKAQSTMLDDLMYILGDVNLLELKHQDMLAFRDNYRRLPAHRAKKPELQGKTFEELLKVKDTVPFSLTTINNRLSLIQSFFIWLLKHEYIEKNPAHSLIIRERRGDVVVREAFTVADISLLKTKILPLKGKAKQVDKYWITLLALYTGARIGEIAGLTVRDIKTIDGIPCINIADNDDRTLKTTSSIRTIPIHSQIIDAGFLDFVTTKNGNLFSYGSNANTSKWFNRMAKNDYPGRKVVFHSLRHTVASVLQTENIEKEKISALLGHTQESVTLSVYGKGYSAKQMQDVVETLTY